MKKKKRKVYPSFFFKKSIQCGTYELLFAPQIIVHIKEKNTLFIYCAHKNNVRILKKFWLKCFYNSKNNNNISNKIMNFFLLAIELFTPITE